MATPWAAGPWDTGYCHGGAVAGLLARVGADVPTRVEMGLARLTMDLFAPVPIGQPISPRVQVEKDGARVQHLRVELLVHERIVATGILLRVRAEPPNRAHLKTPEVDPAQAVRGAPGGFANSFDTVAERGGIALKGPGRVWFRLAAPLIEEEPVDLVAYAVAVADFSSAIGMSRDYRRYSFPSVDLTVGLARAPVNDWMLVDASNHDSDLGRATCHSVLSDAQGPFARVVQTNFVEERAVALTEAVRVA